MDMTQAAVSKYLGQTMTKTKLEGEVSLLSKKITEMFKTGEDDADQIVREICSVCMRSRLGSTLCEVHQEKVPSRHVIDGRTRDRVNGEDHRARQGDSPHTARRPVAQ